MAIKTLGKYELMEELGRGGYGTVYRARDTTLDVERAVKILHPSMASDPEFIIRFKREAKFAAKLEHPNIVPVYELGEIQGSYFLAMKFIPGGSLKSLLQSEGRLSFECALQISQQVASALDFAHGQELIHRDVKPGNILLETDGTVRLSDFGFSKTISGAGSASLSTSGGMLGTPSYMAPEVWLGKDISAATDVYSFACVFFEMITGTVLFAGESPPVIMTHHMLEGPKFPGKWPLGVPDGLEKILKQALSTNPLERYPSASAFTAACAKLLMLPSVSRQPKIAISVPAADVKLASDLLPWRTVVWIILIWSIGFGIVPQFNTVFTFPVTFVICGGITGFVLLRSSWKPVFWLMCGWGIASIFIRSVVINEIITSGIIGALGGITTGLVLRKEKKIFSVQSVLWVVAGWSLGWIIGVNALMALSSLSSGGINFISFACLGACVGALGGFSTVWQIREAQKNRDQH